MKDDRSNDSLPLLSDNLVDLGSKGRDEVDHRGTSQTCPNCRASVRKELGDRTHNCADCHYVVNRDIASAQELCNRGMEKHSTQGLWGKEIGCQVGLSGAMSLDKWRRTAISQSRD